MMIHDASGIVVGRASDMGAMANVLDTLSQTIAQVYADRAGGTPDHWRQAMLTETWYSAAGRHRRLGRPRRVATTVHNNAVPTQLSRAVAVAAARRARNHRLTAELKG